MIFRSSLYNNIASVVDDNSLPDPLPILTPPPTPSLSHHSLSNTPQLHLPSASTLPSSSNPLTAVISPRASSPPDDEANDADDVPTLRQRHTTHSSNKPQPTAAVASPVSTPIPSHPSISTPHDTADLSAVPSPTSPPPPQRVLPSQILPSVPFHRKSQPSILSAEAAPVNIRGLYNLAGLTLFTLTARLVLENVSKYGIMLRFNVLTAFSADPNWPCLIVALFICVGSPLIAWALEWAASERRLSQQVVAWIHAVHIALVLVVPCVIITLTKASYMSGLVLVLVDMLLTMKLVSYAHVCHDIRGRLFNPSPLPASPLPPHLDVSALHPHLPSHYTPSLSHTFYFMAAPTLIYQLSYPRSPSIRLPFLARRLIELCFCLTLQLLLIEQYLHPTVMNAMTSIQTLNYLSILERILKIALPNGCVWLLMFYGVFHSWLNVVGEVLRFGDRLFYKEWWNCQDLAVYWSSWNLPVHHWIMRHLYAPALRWGMTPTAAQILSFLVSAVMHEMLVSVPFHTLQLYAFMGMVAQVPLIWFTKWYTATHPSPPPTHLSWCLPAVPDFSSWAVCDE